MDIELVAVGPTPTPAKKRIGVTVTVGERDKSMCFIRLCDPDTGELFDKGMIAAINPRLGLRRFTDVNPCYGLPLDDKGRINLWE